MATETHVFANGAWRKTKNIYARAGGQWRDCKEVWVKSGGVWKKVFSKGFQLTDTIAGGYNYNVYTTAINTGQWDGVTPVFANITVNGSLGSSVSTTYDWLGYINSNPDLVAPANAFFKGPVVYAKWHWFTLGVNENRVMPMNVSPPAFTTGNLPAGSVVTLTVNAGAYVTGAGGIGGEGGVFNVRGNHVGYTPSTGGFPGGTAIQATVAMTIINNGVIGGGGGGGGGGSGASGSEAYDDPGGSGGGGAGNIFGVGGVSGRNGTFIGQPGNQTTGGLGGTISNQGSGQWAGARNGANGGDLGQPGGQSAPGSGGGSGATVSGFPGGAAGLAISGVSNVTWQVLGDIRGAQS